MNDKIPKSVLIDTHILLWWLEGSVERLSAKQRSVLNGNVLVSLSVMSLWEIAMLIEKGKIQLAMSVEALFELIDESDQIEVLPLTTQIILDSVRLPQDFHKDPVDRMIVSTARAHRLPLITADQLIRDSRLIEVIS